MSIHVYNSEYFDELRHSALSANGSPKRSAKSPDGRGSVIHSSISSALGSASPNSKSYASELSKETQMRRVALKHEQYKKEQEALQKKINESIQENIQKLRAKKEASYLKLRKEVEDGKVVAEELLEKVELHDQIKRRQFQLMHEEWKREVYNKLNSPIVEKVKAMDSKELNRTRVETYQRFLDVSNKKGSLFRDIIIESEYNPLNDVKPLSFHTLVDDPIKRVIRRREEEDAIAREDSSLTGDGNDDSKSIALGSGKGLGGSDRLDVKLWSSGAYESTPYGYFHKMMNSTSTPQTASTYASRVTFDHYNIERGPEVLQRELPKGKRTNFEGYDVKIPKNSIKLSYDN